MSRREKEISGARKECHKTTCTQTKVWWWWKVTRIEEDEDGARGKRGKRGAAVVLRTL